MEKRNESDRNAEDWKSLGVRHFTRDEFDAAVHCFSAAIEIDPSNHAILSNRSVCYATLGNYHAALCDADKVIQLKPEWFKGYLRRGVALQGLMMYKEAKIAFEKGVSINNQDSTLNSALEEISKIVLSIESSMSKLSVSGEGAEDLKSLTTWTSDHGALFPKTQLQIFPGYRYGVQALTKVTKSEMLLFVPLELLMTTDLAKQESPMCKALLEAKYASSSAQTWLALYILEEIAKKEESKWYHYMQVLPKTFEKNAIFFNDEQLNEYLKGSSFLDLRKDWLQRKQNEYAALCEILPYMKNISEKEFFEACLIVASRNYGLMINGRRTTSLIPLAGMFNHPVKGVVSPAIWRYNDDRQGFEMNATSNVRAADQVYNSYGNKCNTRLYLTYGFALRNNPDNTTVFTLQLDSKDPHLAHKQKFWVDENDPSLLTFARQFVVDIDTKAMKTRNLFSFLRLIMSQGDDLLYLPAPHTFRETHLLPALGLNNEIKILERLRDMTNERLSGFRTTITADEKILDYIENGVDETKMSGCAIECLKVVLGEKKVLQWYIDLADKCITLLQSPWKVIKKEYAKCQKNQNEPYNHYVIHTVVPIAKTFGTNSKE